MALIRNALARFPNANLAASLENLTVIDIDGPAGRTKVDELSLPATVGVKTSRGLSAYMGGARDMHRQNEVGEFLAQLTEIAESVGCGVLAIAHLNKQSDQHPLYRIVGSIGFVASIRSALFFGRDPEDENRRALAHGKSNAAAKGATLVFEIKGGGRDDVPLLTPVATSDATELDVCAAARNSVGRPDDRRKAATEFVLEFLDNRPRSWDALVTAGEARRVASRGTFDKVRTELARSGRIIQVGKGRNAKWRLGAGG